MLFCTYDIYFLLLPRCIYVFGGCVRVCVVDARTRLHCRRGTAGDDTKTRRSTVAVDDYCAGVATV